MKIKKLISIVLSFALCLSITNEIFADYIQLQKSHLYEKVTDTYELQDKNVISLVDYPTHIKIKRTDVKGESVVGSEITVLDSNKNKIISFETTDVPYELIGLLNVGETYTFVETKSITGHIAKSSMSLRIKDIADVQTVTISDSKNQIYVKDDNNNWESSNGTISLIDYPTNIVIHRVTYDGTEHITGSTITVTDSSGNEITKFTTDSKAYELKGLLTIGETYTFTETNSVTGHIAKSPVVLKIEDTSDIQEVTIRDTYEKWILINNDSFIDTHINNQSEVCVRGQYYFLDNEDNNVIGNSHNNQIVLSGNNEKLSNDTRVYLSEGVNGEEKLDTNLNYKEIKNISVSENTVNINNTDFMAIYKTTYYCVKIIDGNKENIIKMKIITNTGNVEVLGFQMNTNQNEGAVASKSPSFRVVSKTSNVMTIGNELYEVKKMGTVYAAADKVENLKGNMTLEGVVSDEYIKNFETTDKGKLVGYTTTEADTNYNTYFALTFEYKSYMYPSLEQDYAFRAYAVLDDGRVVYGHKIYTTNMYKIAQNLYDNQKMGTQDSHNFLYNNILNLIDMDKNANQIANAMFRAMEVKDYADNRYKLVAEMTNDIYNYARCRDGYSYIGREQFKCKKVEKELLDYLNIAQAAKGLQTYNSVYEWIYKETSNYSNKGVPYKGCYRIVNYGWDNIIHKNFHIK